MSDAKDSPDTQPRPATYLVGAGRRPEWTSDPRLGGGVVNPPVWRASTILYDNVGQLDSRGRDTHDKLFYGRRGTPTVWALADALTGMEPGAAGTLLYPSGVAALAGGLLALLSPGDHLLMVDSVYDPTRALCDGLLKRMGIATTYYDPLIGAGIAALIRPETCLIFLESPGSLTFEVQDVPAITSVARAHGVLTMIDNTWATPLLFPALAHGIDVTCMSLTKYVGGHSDAMMGSLTANDATWDRLRTAAYHLGQSVSPDDCALMLRGLRTLDVRMARHGDSALQIARWLDTLGCVGTVLHPALPGCPGHDVFVRDFDRASGLFGFTLNMADWKHRASVPAGKAHPGEAGEKIRAQFIDQLALFGIGYSWGGFESLAIPVNPPRSAVPWAGDGPLVRLSIGLEDPADLIADLHQALAAAGLTA